MAKKKPKATTGQFSALVLRALKQEVNQKAGDLIENVLKPKHIESAAEGQAVGRLQGVHGAGSLQVDSRDVVAPFRSTGTPLLQAVRSTGFAPRPSGCRRPSQPVFIAASFDESHPPPWKSEGRSR
jgi:hypothetical protein